MPESSFSEDEGEYFYTEKPISLTDPKILLIIFVTFLWIFFRPVQDVFEIGRYDAYYFIFIIGVLLAQSGYTYLLHKTPKLVCDPIHTTTVGYGDQFGIYTVFTMGDIRYGTFELRGNKGTIIVPTAAVRQLGRNITLDCAVRPISEQEIPFSIRREVLARGIYKPPFYRGYVSDITLRSVPLVSKLIAEVDLANAQANMLHDEVYKRLGRFEEYQAAITRGGKMFKETLIDRIRKKEEEED